MEKLRGKWVEVQGYKHDGRMHRIWDSTYVIDETDEYVVVSSKKVKVIEHDFRIWYTKEPAIMVFFKDKWWNIIAMFKKGGITYYVNLASPFIIDKQKIKYIDYDLDLRVFPDKSFKILDRNEYKYHKKIMNYSDELNYIIEKSLSELIELKKKNEGPFKEKVVKDLYHEYEKLLKESQK